MYDFILFENYLTSPNHYKDVCIIARMLKANGYYVAIADVFNEGTACKEPGIEHYIFKEPWLGRIDTESVNNPIRRFVLNKLNKIRMNRRLSYCMKDLRGKVKNIYGGSQYIGMPTGWVKKLERSTNLYLWGLRSFWLVYFKYSPYTIAGMLSRFFYPYVLKHNNIKFFVSDDLIKSEFESLGVSSNRLVIRPERYIEQLRPCVSKKHVGLHLLTMGSLRENKRIEIALDALKICRTSNIYYAVAGRVQSLHPDIYEKVLSTHIAGLDNVTRINRRLSEEEYEALLSESDFYVMCDEKQLSVVSSGTMNEALLHGLPVIVPDYNPYKDIVEKFHIGFTYNPDNVEDLVQCFQNAKKYGKEYFKTGIERYQKTLLFENVCSMFNEELKRAGV